MRTGGVTGQYHSIAADFYQSDQAVVHLDWDRSIPATEATA